MSVSVVVDRQSAFPTYFLLYYSDGYKSLPQISVSILQYK